MENFSKIGIFLFVICLYSSVTCRSMPPVRHYTLDRLNIKRTDLKQMCDARGENLFEDIHAKHISFTLNLTERFMTWKKEISSVDDVYKLVQERCNKDAALKDILKKFIESSQLCMEEKDRLKEDKMQALSSRLMELFCAQYTHSHAFSSDEGCLDLVTNAAIDTCKEKYKTDQFIPLPFVYNNKECNDYQKYSECRLEAMKSCKDATKTAVEAADSIMFHTFYGCHNISVIPEKITIKRSTVESEEIIRFNMTTGELEKRCNLYANTSFENIKKSHATNLVLLIKEYISLFLKTKLLCITESIQQDSLIQEGCFYNPIVKAALEKMYETIELCLPERERFSEENKTKLLKQSLDEFCSVVRNGVRIISTDDECFQDSKMYLKIALCDTRKNSQNFSTLSTLPFMHTAEECNVINESRECQINIIKDCENSTKLAFHSRFNDMDKFFGCNNEAYNIATPNG